MDNQLSASSSSNQSYVSVALSPTHSHVSLQQPQQQNETTSLPSSSLFSLEEEMKITLDKWPKLSAEGKVATREFLQCSNLVVKFIESLGIAFSPVSRDVHGNIKKVMTKYVQDADRYKYLQDIIDDELSSSARLVTEALLWLKRGLNFLCTFLQTIVDDYEAGSEPESLTLNLRSSYEATLGMYHGMILRQLFNILCQAAPSRTQLIQRLLILVNEEDRQTFMSEVKVFYQGLRVNLDALFAFYKLRNLYQNGT